MRFDGKALLPVTGCQNNHDMLRTTRVFYPTCEGSSTAMEWGTAANALYACLTLMGNSLKVSGDGARGCTEGSNAKESRIEGSKNWPEWGTQRERSNNAWLESMHWTVDDGWRDGWKHRRQEADCGKLWLYKNFQTPNTKFECKLWPIAYVFIAKSHQR